MVLPMFGVGLPLQLIISGSPLLTTFELSVLCVSGLAKAVLSPVKLVILISEHPVLRPSMLVMS